jgi:hypothetical protein
VSTPFVLLSILMQAHQPAFLLISIGPFNKKYALSKPHTVYNCAHTVYDMQAVLASVLSGFRATARFTG